ncbi:histidine phosphatase family protein, partial [Mycobacterium mantenii]
MSGRLILMRHGQSFGNVERRLDTRPPGAELTPLGRDQARAVARGSSRPAMLAHSVATRASQTAAVIGGQLEMPPIEMADIHEVQVGRLENRNDDDAVAEFNAIYERWHHGELDVALPGGETG